jgi:addiction module RelE/StbE family toxin
MEKPKLIIWRKAALKQVGEILDFYQNEYSIQASENLVNAIEATIEKVYKHPTIGQPSAKKKGVRSWIVKEHYRLFYIVKLKQIVVIAFYDLRQHPSKRIY